ncbi:hypothetical protein BDY19DRAFT_701531 [Irpex rosettiformis]|uniref:Uncharacterized protein n=1 Tax=Irpex rosettiformis TaxID=378272 RepID=A0ACB8TN46_9APHY|nr:hypothetical protein BDY19DRAFT_701531 [Irpex rosettiformis]
MKQAIGLSFFHLYVSRPVSLVSAVLLSIIATSRCPLFLLHSRHRPPSYQTIPRPCSRVHAWPALHTRRKIEQACPWPMSRILSSHSRLFLQTLVLWNMLPTQSQIIPDIHSISLPLSPLFGNHRT